MKEAPRDSISLNKFISRTGICSRREADQYILEGRVTLNDQPTRPGNRVSPGDVVRLDGTIVGEAPKTIYLAFNKPVGIVCTTDTSEPNNIVDFIDHPERLFHVGRLDKASTGLIFMTNDGDIVNKILRAGNLHEKEYIVAVDKPITHDFLRQMQEGVPILGTITKKCRVEKLGVHRFRIVLVQGLNRQIRRMCSYLGYQVSSLQRVRIMHVRLRKLPVGAWRPLTAEEEKKLMELVADSSKTG